MGKYMRKAKITTDVAVTDLSQSSLGVRTRARTRLEAAKTPEDSSACYLQLRNRRLEKTNDVVKPAKSSAKESCRQKLEVDCCGGNPKSRLRPVNSGGSDSVNCSRSGKGGGGDRGLVGRNEQVEGFDDLGVEASFGENNLEFQGRQRSTRESTPCSLIRGSDTISNPGSSTRPTSLAASNPRTRNSLQQDVPTNHEMEEFFSFAEQQQQKLFTEKYNFDVVNDVPLPGRYEWVRVCP